MTVAFASAGRGSQKLGHVSCAIVGLPGLAPWVGIHSFLFFTL